jgi:hypothetical protein
MGHAARTMPEYQCDIISPLDGECCLHRLFGVVSLMEMSAGGTVGIHVFVHEWFRRMITSFTFGMYGGL